MRTIDVLSANVCVGKEESGERVDERKTDFDLRGISSRESRYVGARNS